MPHPRPEQVELGAEPDRDPLRGDQAAVLLAQKGAAADRQDAAAPVEQAGDHLGLLAAKERLALALENLGDRAVGRALDLGVAVEERHSQPAGERGPHGGLSRTHHPHQNHRLPEPVGQTGSTSPNFPRPCPEWREAGPKATYINRVKGRR